MHDNRSHPLLEQVPLAVSPFVHLPRATTLPYRYRAMPSALPPSIISSDAAAASAGAAAAGGPDAAARPAYVVSATSGTAAHPDDILASCRALREHIARMQADADASLRELEASIRERDLAERRRVAPGWLDSDERLLVPERAGSASDDAASSSVPAGTTDAGAAQGAHGPSEMAAAMPDLGDQLDRAFGGMRLK